MFKKEKWQGITTDSDEIIAFLGKGVEFKGVITFQGTVRIDGKINGEIITKGTLLVGDAAVIDAEIGAGTVISSGKIIGNIRATQKVHLFSSAVQKGSISAPILVVNAGAVFNGNCEMNKLGEGLDIGMELKSDEAGPVMDVTGKSN